MLVFVSPSHANLHHDTSFTAEKIEIDPLGQRDVMHLVGSASLDSLR